MTMVARGFTIQIGSPAAQNQPTEAFQVLKCRYILRKLQSVAGLAPGDQRNSRDVSGLHLGESEVSNINLEVIDSGGQVGEGGIGFCGSQDVIPGAAVPVPGRKKMMLDYAIQSTALEVTEAEQDIRARRHY